MKWFEDVKTPKVVLGIMFAAFAFAGFVAGTYFGLWLAGMWV